MSVERIQQLQQLNLLKTEVGLRDSAATQALLALYRSLDCYFEGMLEFPKGLRVLDVVCGGSEENYPPLLAEWFGRLGMRVTGVDLSGPLETWRSYDHMQRDLMHIALQEMIGGGECFDVMTVIDWVTPSISDGVAHLSRLNELSELQEFELSMLLQARFLLVPGGVLCIDSVRHDERKFYMRTDAGDMEPLERRFVIPLTDE